MGCLLILMFDTFRNCSFVNFTNISNAIKAIDGIKNKPDYANLRIAHGKDRCANPPRSGPQGGGGMRRSASGTSGAGGVPSPGIEVHVDGEGFENGVGGIGEGEAALVDAGRGEMHVDVKAETQN